MAYSECSPEGEWFDSALGKPYTHYSQCPDVAGFQVGQCKVLRFSGCCSADSQADEDQNQLNNNLKIAKLEDFASHWQ